MSLQFNEYLIGKHGKNDRRSLTSKNCSRSHQNRDLFIRSIFRSRFVARVNDVGYDTFQRRIILFSSHISMWPDYIFIFLFYYQIKICPPFPNIYSWRDYNEYIWYSTCFFSIEFLL